MNSERGSVLIIVVWGLAIISLIATFMLYRAGVEWSSTLSFEQKVKFRQVAEATLRERLVFLVSDKTGYDSQEDDWFSKDGTVDMDEGRSIVQKEQNGFKITVSIEDEGSKPNLNIINGGNLRLIANEGMISLSKLSAENGLQPIVNEGISLIPVLDWRDVDSDLRDGGAETTYYQGLKPTYKCRDGFFSSVEELKLLKNGDKIYPLLAPKVTVYGKINPNIIESDTFAALLKSVGGFEDFWINLAKVEFESYKIQQIQPPPKGFHFDSIDDFKSSAFTIGRRDQMRPFLKFSGSCNINLVSKIGLQVMLKEAGYNPNPDAMVDPLIKQRAEQPFQNWYMVNDYIRSLNNSVRYPQDYFTVVSTIIRYRIWISKGSNQYYLETVQERFQEGLKKEWQLHPLLWRELMNKEVPELPKIRTAEEIKEETKEDNDKTNNQQ